jgi:hypothetical protein
VYLYLLHFLSIEIPVNGLIGMPWPERAIVIYVACMGFDPASLAVWFDGTLFAS